MSSYELIIAEKRTLGEDLARSLGGGKSREGYIEGNGWVVTWAAGHLLEMLSPKDYDPKNERWSMENLPIIPEPFKYKKISGKGKYLDLIKKLAKGAHTITNAGDADREGQLLVDEVIDIINWKGVEKRIWFNELTDSGMRKAFESRGDNRDYRRYSRAAECRSKSDWILGMNFSPLFSFRFQSQKGVRGTMSVGRVMSLVNALVVERERAIKNFNPKDFFELYANFNLDGFEYRGKWDIPKDLLDGEGYLTNRAVAEEALEKVEGENGEVVEVDLKNVKSNAPMPYTITELQKDANKKLKWTSAKTLSVAQSLYSDKKMTSYPRTEHPYMPESMRKDAPATLEKVLSFMDRGELLDRADWSIKHPVYNDKKLENHYAIIPTGVDRYSSLSQDERSLFDMIALRFLALFYPPKVTENLIILTEVQGENFKTNDKRVIDPGWESLFGGAADDKTAPPFIEEGMAPEVDSVDLESKKTSPPKHYTEAMLVDAMKNISKYVEDEAQKEILKKNAGIGTPATRAAIIEKLVRIKYIKLVKGKFHPTDLGEQNYDILDKDIVSPVVTAEWENKLEKIENEKMNPEEFMTQIKNWVLSMIEKYAGEINVSESTSRGGYPPSKKQLALGKKLAAEQGLDIPEEALENGKAMSEFIDKYIGKGGGGNWKPSKKQLDLAKKLSLENGVPFPESMKEDGKAVSAFIDKQIEVSKKSGNKPPTVKQIAFAKKLSEEKDIKLPKNYENDWKICSDFIEKCLGK